MLQSSMPSLRHRSVAQRRAQVGAYSLPAQYIENASTALYARPMFPTATTPCALPEASQK
jgi:hypothetical protein